MKESEKRNWKKFANGRKPRIYKTIADYTNHLASHGMNESDKSRLPKTTQNLELLFLLIAMIVEKGCNALKYCPRCNLILINEETAELHDRALGHKSTEILDE